MEAYEWDKRIGYLKTTRDLYYNDDYLRFLVDVVWNVQTPQRLIDFGCGFGYLGLKLLPLLPAGSSYTGVDLGTELLAAARSQFRELPYETEFIHGDIHEVQLERSYDIALTHAVLLHVPDPRRTLRTMLGTVVDGGRVICFETHWNAAMAGLHLHGQESSGITNLGVLQRLFEEDIRRSGRDGNIGLKLPAYMSELGLQEIGCRVSDKVNLLYPGMDPEAHNRLFQALQTDGVGAHPGEQEAYVQGLVSRGLSPADAAAQYACELRLSREFGVNSLLASAAGMKITYGTVRM